MTGVGMQKCTQASQKKAGHPCAIGMRVRPCIGPLREPPGASGTSLLLARASAPEQAASIGNQAGGRVFLFLQTDDFWRDYNRMVSVGVTFVRPPDAAAYGTVAAFEDLYGNRWDLLQYNVGTPYAALAV